MFLFILCEQQQVEKITKRNWMKEENLYDNNILKNLKLIFNNFLKFLVGFN